MTRPLLSALAATVAVSICGLSAQQRFLSSVGVVTMNVAVRLNGAPARGLTASDFELTDNFIARKVDVSLAASRPADITLLIDTSGSMDGSMEEMRDHVRDVARLLGRDDRLRLLTFGDDVREVFGFRAGDSTPPLDALTAGGWTALYDALGLALIHQPAPERSHLIVVFSDGIDSSSTIDLNTLKELTRRSDAVLQTFIDVPRPTTLSRRALPSRETPPRPPVGVIADLTGGNVTFMGRDDDVPGSFRAALAEFRQRYVLTYAIPEPVQSGWHNVTVTVKRPGNFEVRTRKGYVQ